MKAYEQYIETVVKKFENKEKNSKNELITHSILGLGSEIGEYLEGVIMGDKLNIKEEFGDVTYFFWQGVGAIGFDPFDIDLKYSVKDAGNMGLNKMIVSQSRLEGMIKNYMFYDAEFPSDDDLKLEYARFYFNFKYLLNENNLSEVEIMQSNARKLEERYGEKFSKEAALNRDKEKELAAV